MAHHPSITRAQSYLKLLRKSDDDATALGLVTLAQEQLKLSIKHFKHQAGAEVPGQKAIDPNQVTLPVEVDGSGVVITDADKDKLFDVAKAEHAELDDVVERALKCPACGAINIEDDRKVGDTCGAPVMLDGARAECLGVLVAVSELREPVGSASE